VNTGAPSGVACTTCTTDPEAARYFCRSEKIALRDEVVFAHVSLPDKYSFCASIIISVLFEVVAVEGGTPIRERKEGALELVDMVA
jgi:hypothetical protein